ncbi:MAG TPA: DUF4149 domain-containing protein [Gammaproteobacteria bacterium]
MALVERTPAVSTARSDTAIAVFAVVSLVWIGVVLGVSFLATPVKFLAPSLTLPVALDVGRQTFHWYNRVELVIAAVTLIAAIASDRQRIIWHDGADGARRGGALPYATLVAAFLLAAVVLQGFFLLPRLDARVEVIIQGGTPPASVLHDVYVAVEAVKLGALVGAAWLGVAGLRGRASAGR